MQKVIQRKALYHEKMDTFLARIPNENEWAMCETPDLFGIEATKEGLLTFFSTSPLFEESLMVTVELRIIDE